MNSESISRERDLNYHINPYTNLKTNETNGPLVIEKGEGVFVYDKMVKNIWKECLDSGVSL